jgi:hypothetical protein
MLDREEQLIRAARSLKKRDVRRRRRLVRIVSRQRPTLNLTVALYYLRLTESSVPLW